MKITFLGTNGWYDSPMGSTPSVLIDASDCYIILDAGFGIAKASDLIVQDKPVFLFLSHFHIDHICGLHTLSKLKLKRPLTIFGSKGLKKMLKTIFVHPYAADMKEVGFKIIVKELKEGSHTESLKFDCRRLQHIDLALGYRLYLDNKIITYCTDTKVCNNDSLLAKEADVLIHECGYTVKAPDDFWGHTSPEEAGELAQQAGVKRLFITNFGPNAFDTREKRISAEKKAQKYFLNTQAAFDGTIFEL